MEEVLNQNKNHILVILLIIILPLGGYYFGRQSIPVQSSEIEIHNPSQCEIETDQKTYHYEVFGEVKKPGVYSSDNSILVIDAIERAGGFTEKADKAYVFKNIKLAVTVNSADKIFIPAIGESPLINTDYESESNKINLNTASTAQLDTVSGIGEITAKKIIAARPFKSCEDVNKIPDVNKTVKQNLIEVCIL